ncbi:Heparinase II/III-like protein [Opitutaceae bacterium TAV1]|nr:Heparinase II/III-like protein [Opitutaceae bacterium TAV1]
MSFRKHLCLFLPSLFLAAAVPATPPTPRDALARIAADDSLANYRQRLVDAARRDAGKPILRRPQTLEELQSSPTAIRYKTKPAHFSKVDDANWRTFALSLGDVRAGETLVGRLPRIAAGYVFSGDPALLEHVTAQLAELATWSPLQRPGWSINNGNPRLRPGGDGAWLGTGYLVRAITDTLSILPADALASDLRAALHARLESEIASIEEDFRTGRPWYVRARAIHSNQWVLPNEALVRACLALPPDRAAKHSAALELGVSNLLLSLDAQGSQGEFVEGHAYAAITLGGVLSAARATATAPEQDTRLLDHPFLQNFPTWFAHHIQPGGQVLNAFDSGNRAMTAYQSFLAAFVAATGSPVALWTLRNHTGFPDNSPDGLVARLLSPTAVTASPPPLFAHYPVATRVNWRSSWDDTTATGFWMRGGHATDFHDHMDRGHVNFVVGPRPILIEAGTFNYGLRDYPTHYRGVGGHNVLQLGDVPLADQTPEILASRAGQILDARHRSAPMTVQRMDADGGSATVDVSSCYKNVSRWVRHVEWDCSGLTVRDEVALDAADIVLFRWHLGLRPGDATTLRGTQLTADGFTLAWESTRLLLARMETMPDTTLEKGANELGRHQALVVRSREPVTQLVLTTRLRTIPAAPTDKPTTSEAR